MAIKQILCALTLCAGTWLWATAQCEANAGFGADFADTTLRVDYVLGGTAASLTVSVSRVGYQEGWGGRRKNLGRYPLAGNIGVTVTDKITGDTIYSYGLSSLYSEWLQLNDSVARAYECPVLVPRPRRDAVISLQVRDSRHQTIAEHKLPYSPADVLVRRLAPSGYNVTPIHTGSSAGTKIPVAILPEGFTEDEMDSFHDYAKRTVEAIFKHEPFGKYRERFDFFAVDVPSRDSDVSHPADGKWCDTPFGSHFSTFLEPRYLTTSNMVDVHNALAGTPYQHIIILANTATYGGGGIFNSYTLTNTGNPQFEPVVVHEFGHSFGGLGDEYFYADDVFSDTYPTDIEPWEPNLTTLTDFHGKWENLIAEGTPMPTPTDSVSVKKYPVGLYEGGGYAFKGVYRPADLCRMRVNDVDAFCPACQQALERLILFLTE